ncbi:MAG: hypothetical protein EOM68_01335 [Spirochaetia bacterium]|jgi:hypothetical protein|nr:hypothetical protein [Spirochaetia bacterium]
MKNAPTILLSAGVLLVGFTLLTPLLFFLIGFLLDKHGNGSILLGMDYAFLSFGGLVLLVLGSLFAKRYALVIGITSGVATLAMVGCFYATEPKGLFDWFVSGCYYLSLLVALGVSIAILHTREG